MEIEREILSPVENLSLPTKVDLSVRLAQTLWRRNVYARTAYSLKVPDNSKFVSADEAVKLIPDEAVLVIPAFAANKHASTLYRALAKRFQKTQHPKNISLICASGMGSRGKSCGSVEDLGIKGLCTRFFTGHAETYKSILKLADQNALELQIVPQGVLLLAVGEQAETGKLALTVECGEGTFLDPRVGRGTGFKAKNEQFVKLEQDGKLTYSLPKITGVLFSAPAADRKGNIYVKGAAVLTEDLEAAQAAKRHGGVVIVQVGLIVEEGYSSVFIPSTLVDAVVYHPYTEQTLAAPFTHPFQFLTLEYNPKDSQDQGLKKIQFINKILKATPTRSPVDQAMARLGASILVENISKGAAIDIGTGLPEEVALVLHQTGILKDINIFTESGVFGGIPCPGAYFGASVHPREIVSSIRTWRRVYTHLDVIIVGALEVDSFGNVNVSKRGEGAINYVGPGGFIDLTTQAKLCIFCCAWMNGGDIQVIDEKVIVKKHGKPKFIPKVNEITFCAETALKMKKKVYYITPVGLFTLTSKGLQLLAIMPGVNLEKDILKFSTASVSLPPSSSSYLTKVPIVNSSIVTGKGFKLNLRPSSDPVASTIWLNAKL